MELNIGVKRGLSWGSRIRGFWRAGGVGEMRGA